MRQPSQQGGQRGPRASPKSIDVRALFRRLVGLWKSGAFAPSYRDEDLVKIVARSTAARQSRLLRGILARSQTHGTDSACSLLVIRFDQWLTPRWFADVRAVLRNPSARDARLQAWMQAADRQMVEATRVGLALPGGHSAPLRAGFPWRGVAGAGPADLLFAVHPHRFAFAPRLALAVMGGTIPATHVLDILDDWMRFARAHPALPFVSNLVVIQRLIASAWAFAYLGAAAEGPGIVECRFALLKIIGQDVAFLVPRLGSSYPNNHLLLDRFASWLIALVFPEMLRKSPRLEAAAAAWLEELRHQTYGDGGGIEQSVHYHGLACEMAAAYLLLSRAKGQPVAAADLAHIGRMLRLQAELCGTDGAAPSIGDSSDDPLFPLDAGSGGNAAALRELYRALFAPEMLPVQPDHPAIERAFWLLGGRLAQASALPQEARYAEYPQSGFAIFPDDLDSTRCVLRIGPATGTRVLPGHMHSDVLSITLTYLGIPLMIDAGTFTYRFRPDAATAARVNWRAYFAGARSHNGLVVEGSDPLGMLSRSFRGQAELPIVTRIASGGDDKLAFHEATLEPQSHHPGFTRGIVHLRGAGFLVYNFVHAVASAVQPRLAFQLAPDCRVHRVDDMHVRVQRGQAALAIAYSPAIGPMEEVSGRESPTNGWASSRYGMRVPAPQLLFDVAAEQPSAFALYGNHLSASFSIECRQPTSTSRAFRIRSDTATDVVLLNVDQPDAAVSQWGVSFRGRLAWLRIPDAGAPVIRCLDGLSCDAPEHGVQHRFETRRPALLT